MSAQAAVAEHTCPIQAVEARLELAKAEHLQLQIHAHQQQRFRRSMATNFGTAEVATDALEQIQRRIEAKQNIIDTLASAVEDLRIERLIDSIKGQTP